MKRSPSVADLPAPTGVTKIGSSSDDLLTAIEKTAISVLGASNLPTEIHTQVTTINNRTVTESKSPMLIAENKYGKSSPEYYAGSALFWITACRQAIKENKAESAVYATFKITYYFHQLMTDPINKLVI